MSIKTRLSWLAIAAALAAPGVALADSVEDFFSGTTVTLYIGYSTGGGYDTYGRLVATHMGRHIPGNPTIVPTNMPGAGSLRLANWLYEAAPRDGSAFGIVARTVAFEPLLGNDAATFDASQFNYIGNANTEYSLCAALNSSGVTDIESARTTQLLVGGTGTASDPNQQANISNAALGTQMVIIDGYPGGNDISLAMERGEIQGRCGWSWSTIKATQLPLIESGEVTLLYQFASRPHPELQNVPLAVDLAQDDAGRALVAFITAPQEMGRPFFAPPEVPQERVDALQAAFMATMEDPEFLAAAAAAGLEVAPSSGDDLQTLVQSIYATDPAVVEQLIDVLN